MIEKLAGLKGTPYVCLSLLILFSVSTPLAAAPQAQEQAASVQPDRSEAYYHYSLAHLYEDMARQWVRREYVERAVEEYQRAIEADPNSDFLRMELARLYARTNRLEKAVEEASKILEGDPNNAGVHRLLGLIYRDYATDRQNQVNEERLRQAIGHLEKALEIDPSDTESLMQLATLYNVAREADKAEAALKKLLELEPDSTAALSGLASLYLSMGNADGAIEALEKVKASGDADRRQLLALGSAYERAGRYEDAAKVFEEVIEMGGNNLPARKQWAHNLMLSGQFDKALEQYNALIEAEPGNFEHHLRLSQIYRQKRNFRQAWVHLGRAEELAPESLETKYNRVLLLESEGKASEAITSMQELLAATEKENYSQRDKQNRALFYEQLGMLFRQVERFEEATEAYRSMGDLDPQSKPRALAHTVDSYRASRDFKRARETSIAAAKEFPDNRALVILQATVLAETGDSGQAAKLLKRQLQGDRRDRSIYLALAQVYEKGKRFNEALKAVEEAQELSPSKGEKLSVLFTLGSVLERAKRFDQAEAKFRELLAIAPDYSQALNYLGYMLADLNKSLDEAHNMIQKALDTDPDNGAYLDSLGWVYYRQRKFELAERYLVRSLQKVKRDPVVHSHLGDVYFELGKIDQARTHWERSLEEWERSALADRDPAAMAKLRKKLADLDKPLSSSADSKKKNP